MPKYLFKWFWDLWTNNRGTQKTRNPTTTDPTPNSRPSEYLGFLALFRALLLPLPLFCAHFCRFASDCVWNDRVWEFQRLEGKNMHFRRERPPLRVCKAIYSKLNHLLRRWFADLKGCQNCVFGKRCFCPFPTRGGFDKKKGKNDSCAFYPPKNKCFAPQTTKMAKTAGVAHTKHPFPKARFPKF